MRSTSRTALRALAAALAAGLLGCASTPRGSGAASSPEATPADGGVSSTEAERQAVAENLQAQARRELAPLEKHKVTVLGGKYALEVEASAAPVVAPGAEQDSVTVPLGTQQPLTLVLHPVRIDVAGSIMGALAEVGGGLKVESVQVTDIVSVAGAPLVFVEAVYTADSPKGKLVGQLKLGVARGLEASLICVHDELGYSETFERICRGAVEGLSEIGPASPGSAKKPSYRQLQLMRVANRAVGFEETTVRPRDGGGKQLSIDGVMLMPRSATELMAEDSYSIVESDKDGWVVSHSYVKGGAAQEPTTTVTMKRQKGSTFAFEGQVNGKEVKGTFQSKNKKGIASDFRIAQSVRDQLLKGKAKQLTFESYLPSLNPAGTVDLSLAPQADRERGVRWSMGGMELSCTADARGWMERMEMPIGPATLSQARVFEQGEP